MQQQLNKRIANSMTSAGFNPIQKALTGFLCVCALTLAAGTSQAHDYQHGSIEINHPMTRATPPGTPVAGGFLTIKNHGDSAIRLVGAKVDFAETTEIHTVSEEGGVMRMQQVQGGLEIAAGGEQVLKPGSYHLMFMKLKMPLKEGEKHKGVLQFEKAGSVDVVFNVEAITSAHEGMDHSKHDMGAAPMNGAEMSDKKMGSDKKMDHSGHMGH